MEATQGDSQLDATANALNDALPMLSPLSLGELLDRALRQIMPIFGKMWILFVILALINVGMQVLQGYGQQYFFWSVWVVLFLYSIYLGLIAAFLASAHWCGTDTLLKRALRRLRIWQIVQLVGLFIWVSVATFVGLLLFVIPGLVYAMNRCLVVYVLLIERTTVFGALRKSKFLMTRTKWYSLSGPMMRIFGLSAVLWTMIIALAVIEGLSATLTLLDGIYFSSGLVVLFFSSLIGGALQIFTQAAYVGFYYDLRTRYEGTDLMAQLSAYSTQSR